MHFLFMVDAALSHYTGSFGVADLLYSRGHTVTYLDENKGIEPLVTKRGFAFRYLDLETLTGMPEPDAASMSWRSRVKYLKAFRGKILENNLLDEIINEIRPDAVFIDQFLLRYHPILCKYKIPIIRLSINMPCEEDSFAPPNSSTIVPGMPWYKQLESRLAWYKLRVKRAAARVMDPLTDFSNVNRPFSMSVLRELAVKNGFPFDEKVITSLFHFDLKDVPMLALCNREFDFRKDVQSNTYYIGREFVAVDVDSDSARKASQFLNSINGPLVLCALGTLTHSSAKAFLQRVISAFGQMPDVNLIVASNVPFTEQWQIPSNVRIFKRINQIDVLCRCDLMIHHGGPASALECIRLNVPMLVYPINNDWDYNGAATRVIYHNIGLRGDLRIDKEADIIRKVKTILDDRSFNENISGLNARFVKHTADDVFGIITKIISTHGATETALIN